MVGFRIAVIVFMCVFAAQRADSEALADSRAEVQSDRLIVDHGNRTARFVGQVRATYQGLTMTCDELVVTYGSEGHVESLQARGRVSVKKDGAVAEAQSARLDARGQRLLLEGEPRLRRGANTLLGSRITIHLRQGRIDVEEARGTFHFRP